MSYYIKLNYNNFLFKGLIDSGATICAITPMMVKKLGLVATNNISGYVQGIGRTKIVGEVKNCNLSVNGINVLVDFIILNNQNQSLVILGQDFLEKYKCIINCHHKNITINNKEVPIVPFITIKPVKPTIKPKVVPKVEQKIKSKVVPNVKAKSSVKK